MYYAAESLAESTARDTLETRALILHAFQRKYTRSAAATATGGPRGVTTLQSRAASSDSVQAPPNALQIQLARLLREGAAAQAATTGAAAHTATGGGVGASGGSAPSVVLTDVQRQATVARLKVLVHAKYCGTAPGTACPDFPECATYKKLWPHLEGVSVHLAPSDRACVFFRQILT